MQTVALVLASSQPEDAPEPEDVTAGTWGLVVFVLLILATVVLMRSFLKQMRKTEAARRAGVFGEVPDDEAADNVDDGVDNGVDNGADNGADRS